MRNRWNKPDDWNRLIVEGIESAFAKNGWRIFERIESNLVWWVERVWMIESAWTPIGIRVHMSFLTEPEGSYVQALAIDLAEPDGRLEAGKVAMAYIGDREEAFTSLISQLNTWRDEQAKSED